MTEIIKKKKKEKKKERKENKWEQEQRRHAGNGDDGKAVESVYNAMVTVLTKA